LLAGHVRETQPRIDQHPEMRFDLWRVIYPVAGGTALPRRYRVEFRDAASVLNLNVASETELLRFLAALGYAPWRAVELTAGIIALRPFAGAARIAQLSNVAEDDVALILPHVTTLGSGRINLNTASVPVLASVRGITIETARAIVQRRAEIGPIASAYAVEADISKASRDSLFAEASSLAERLVSEVTEAEIRSTGFNAGGRPGAVAVGLIVRNGAHVVLVNRRFE
jgi:type II secretory pathway component PulK